MKIGVLSDTHLTSVTPELRALLQGPFRDVDLILHAGDIVDLAVLESFAPKEFLAVFGNMDPPPVRRELPSKRLLRLGSYKIGLIHGWGGPKGIEERLRQEFTEVNAIIYGHTHTPAQGEREGVFFFNPGSFGGAQVGSQRSVGLLSLDGTMSGKIIYL